MTSVTSGQRSALERASELALQYLDGLERSPVAPTATLAELRARLATPLAEDGQPALEVVEALARGVAGGLHGNAGGRFYGWVMGAGLPAALASDWLTATWDQNAGLYACSPAAAVVEEAAGSWLKELLGVPAGASFALVTGCQMAHTTCLAAARHELLARRGWDVGVQGLAGSPPIRVLSSGEMHGTTLRSLKLLGIGSAQLELLPAGDNARLAPATLSAGLASRAAGGGATDPPTIVVLQAGDVNCGAFDDFEALVPLAHAAGAWVHVDGAMGLWAAASPAHRHLLQGASGADSWATDGHKWLNVPYDCGYAFVANPAPHRASMAARASYLEHSTDARDPLDWTPEHSRRARGFATWAALRELGRRGVAELVARNCRQATELVERIGALPGASIIARPQINQGLLRFPDGSAGAGEADHDRRTDAVIAAINASGEAFFTGTTWHGHRCMRVSVSSWRTSASDLDRAVAAAAHALAGGTLARPR